MLRSIPLLLVTALTLLGCSGSPETPDEEPTEESTEAESRTDRTEAAPADEETEASTPLSESADPNAPADVAAPPDSATVTESGLVFLILQEGSGAATPLPTSPVTVHYTGWTTDGVKFDSSRDRGEPATFPLDKVIPGWTEGVAMMKVGEKRRLWIPAELAYNNRPGRPQGTLVFDVELLSIGEN